MLWVGGHILLVGADELGWHAPYGLVHRLEEAVHGAGALSGVLAWMANTAASAVVGLAVGLVLTAVIAKLPKRGPAAH
jgi:predicted DNA repair protein MutK